MCGLLGGEYKGNLGCSIQVVGFVHNSSNLGVIRKSKSSLC